MKIYNIPNIDNFFETVNKCKGMVHLISPEGDDIVLTSKLSRFVFATLSQEEINDLNFELVCENNEDTLLFIESLARRK